MAKKIKIREIASKIKVIETKEQERDTSELEAEINQPVRKMRSGGVVTPSLAFLEGEQPLPEAPVVREERGPAPIRENVSYNASLQEERLKYDALPSEQAARPRTQGQFIAPILRPEEPGLRDPLHGNDPFRNTMRGLQETEAGAQRREYDLSEETKSHLEVKKRRDWRF